MLFTERPEGSFRFLKASSHSNAMGVLQATEGTEGTQNAAESEGKCSDENGTVIIFFFVHRRINREGFVHFHHLFIAHLLLVNSFSVSIQL